MILGENFTIIGRMVTIFVPSMVPFLVCSTLFYAHIFNFYACFRFCWLLVLIQMDKNVMNQINHVDCIRGTIALLIL